MPKVTFSESGAKRIAAATLAHERGNRDAPPVRFRQVGDDMVVRLCKLDVAFNKGQVLPLVNVYESGTPPDETLTQGVVLPNVVNKFANIAANKFFAVAPGGNGYYYVIAAEC